MNRKSSNLAVLVLSAMGVLLAGYLVVEHYLPQAPLPCFAGGGGCESVLQSRYSQIGPIPLALLGFLMYLALLVMAALRAGTLKRQPGLQATYEEPVPWMQGSTEPGDFAPVSTPPPDGVSAPEAEVATDDMGKDVARLHQLDLLLWLLTLAGLAISWALQYVVLFILQSFCPYCFSSALIVSALFMFTSWEYFLNCRPLSAGERTLLGWSIAIIALALGMLYGRVEQRLEQSQANMVAAMNQPAEQQVQGVTRAQLIPAHPHVLGEQNAPFTLVEFGDYQCPSCRRGAAIASELIGRSHGQVRLIFRVFPLTRVHAWSLQAALAAEAAGEMGKFWPMHDYIYQHQDDMSKQSFSAASFVDDARKLGLDPVRFKKLMDSKAVLDGVNQDTAAANSVGVTSTPTFFFVSPKGIWEFSQQPALEAAFANPTHPMWAK
jgi:protein-disulfide isomerase/uncharacterized membrane protein